MDSGNIWTSRDEGVVTQAERTGRVKEMEASKQHVCWGNSKLPGLTGLECAWRAISSIQFSRSVVSDSLRPNESHHALPVHHQLPEFTQTHVHRIGDAIQPSHPLSSPSPPAPNPSQHQSLFQWVNSSHEVAKVLEFQLQHHSFQRTPRTDLL